MADPEIRAELASVAASLRAYLEWQQDCGSGGIPRRPRAADPRAGAPLAAPAAPPAAAGAPPPAEAEPVDDEPPPGRFDDDEPPPGRFDDDEPPPGRFDDGLPPAAPAAPPRRPPEPEAPREVLPPITLGDIPFEPPRAPTPARPAAKPAAPPPPAAPRPLPVVQEEVAGCTKCGLATTRTKTVFARGNPAAQLCIVGEAPGADEDAQGLPFVGRAGQLLDRMIQAMGLNPETDVYVCNIIKCRPPGNRRPEPAEIAACIPYLHEQLAAVDPRAIVAMGNTAVGALLGTTLGITKVRGSWKLYRGKIPVMPTYHPSYLLRPGPAQAEAKRQAWEDLQGVMKELGLSKPPRS